ncbi:glycosyltransferase family 9 protein [bacterium]|nr:glycosyltransferase family 9 protein [bacterium]
MSKVLLIAITRLGDLIQAEPVSRALKRSGRANHVTVLVEESFLSVAESLDGVDEIMPIRFARVLGTLSSSNRQLPLTEYAVLEKFLSKESYEEVWNLTHTRPAMVLSSLAMGQRKHGVMLDATGLQIVQNDWLTYFFASNLARPWCAHNLVDIYVNAVNGQTPFDARIPRLRGVSNRARPLPEHLNNCDVLLHPGASQTDKQWPIDRFVEVAKWLVERGANVTLIGGKREKSLVSHFCLGGRLKSSVGVTSFRELVELCSSAALLISGDSGPVHVAAACGLPVLALEGGSAHAFETAPYNTNCFVIQPHLSDLLSATPDKYRCSAPPDRIESSTVLSTLQFMIGETREPIANEPVGVYRTAMDPETRGIALFKVSGQQNDYERLIQGLKLFWCHALSCDTPTLSVPDQSRLGLELSRCCKLTRSIERASGDMTCLSALASELSAAEEMLATDLSKRPQLHHLQAFLQISRASVTAESLEEQASALSDLYGRLRKSAHYLDSDAERYSSSEMSNKHTKALT